MNAGERIRELRKASGLRQAELAKQVQIDQSTLSDIENGAGFGAEVLVSLAQALQVSAEQIMRGQDLQFWPFQRIPLSRYLSLTEEDRAYVEGKLEAAIETCELRVTPEDRARAERSSGSKLVVRGNKNKKMA